MELLQQRLEHAGFEPGPLDGVYGYLTTDAVRALQREFRLPPDGVAGPRLLALLEDTTLTRQRAVVVVQPGDSLPLLARRLGVSADWLRAANRLPPRRDLYPGQRLIVQQRWLLAAEGYGPRVPVEAVRSLQRHGDQLTGVLEAPRWYLHPPGWLTPAGRELATGAPETSGGSAPARYLGISVVPRPPQLRSKGSAANGDPLKGKPRTGKLPSPPRGQHRTFFSRRKLLAAAVQAVGAAVQQERAAGVWVDLVAVLWSTTPAEGPHAAGGSAAGAGASGAEGTGVAASGALGGGRPATLPRWLIRFLRELRRQGVEVLAMVPTFESTHRFRPLELLANLAGTGEQEVRRLAQLCHRILVATHRAPPGFDGREPPFSVHRLARVMGRFRRWVDPWKLLMGVPLGGLQWDEGVAKEPVLEGRAAEGLDRRRQAGAGRDGRGELRSLTYQKAMTQAYLSGARASWDAEHKVAGYRLATGQVWFENRASVATKLAIVDRFALGGAFLWPAGAEDSRVWDTAVIGFAVYRPEGEEPPAGSAAGP